MGPQTRFSNASGGTSAILNNLAIGTYNAGGYRLSVAGKIRAEEVKVCTGWADFVFADDYSLASLSEIEQYLKENKHLPDIPSEAEVLENGIELGAMDAKLLQKVEELTLYAIEQNKK